MTVPGMATCVGLEWLPRIHRVGRVTRLDNARDSGSWHMIGRRISYNNGS